MNGRISLVEDMEDLYSEEYIIEEIQPENKDYKNWQVSADGKVFFPDIKILVKEKMDSGIYTVEVNNQDGYFARKKEINTDELFKIQDDIISQMISEINLFWKKADLFKSAGIIHKRGILLTGDPGQGKTSVIHLMCKQLVEMGGVVFKIEIPQDLSVYKVFIQNYFRKIEPDTPLLLIIEDIDKILEQKESELLSILDGQDSINHQVVISTTNRISELNDLLLRPSRIDWIIEVNGPDENSRRTYFEKIGLSGEELELFVTKSKGLSMAQLKELYISIKLLDNDMELVLTRLRENKKKAPNTTYKPKPNIGFGK